MAERLGLNWRTDVDRMLASPEHASGWGAFTLGVSDVTPIEMANVFATLAAEGNYCAPLPVLKIQSRDGENTKFQGKLVAAPRCHRVVTADVARAATDAARCVTGYGSARGSCGGWETSPMVYATLHRPVAGKSGTTDSNKTAWFCGFTPQLAAAAFVADPDDPNDYVGSGRSTISKYTVAQTLRDALKGQPKLKFTPPSKQIARHGANTNDDSDDADSSSGSDNSSDNSSGSDSTFHDTSRNDSSRHDSGRHHSSRHHSGRSDSGRGNSGRNDAGRSDSGRGNSGRNDAGRSDSGRSDSGRSGDDEGNGD
jgi:membrane peptidoglycan carboxypeptidase